MNLATVIESVGVRAVVQELNEKVIKYLNGELDRKDLKISDQELINIIEKFRSLGLITTNSYSDN